MVIFQPDRVLIASFVQKYAKELKGHLLDIGGGNKRYRGFFPHVDQYTSLDPDASQHPDLVAGAENIPLDDASIDSILCTETLMDVFPFTDAVKEMARVLKPEGSLIMTSAFQTPLYGNESHYWRFTPTALKKMLEPYFDVVYIERRGGYRCVQVQNWIRYLIERYNLNQHPLPGRMISLVSSIRGRYAIWRDTHDGSDANKKYAIGFNILARKR